MHKSPLKIIIKKLLIFVIFSFPLTSGAYEMINLTKPEYEDMSHEYPNYDVVIRMNFSDTLADYSSLFALKKDLNSDDLEDMFAVAISINSSESGEQRLYIHTSITCNNEYDRGNTVIRTNGKNVKYQQFCDRHVYYTPTTEVGKSYLINELKTKHMVGLKFGDILALFDATGFTKAWNSYGGDAI